MPNDSVMLLFKTEICIKTNDLVDKILNFLEELGVIFESNFMNLCNSTLVTF